MRKSTQFLTSILAFAFSASVIAQDSTITFVPTGAAKKASGKPTWIVGLHGVAIDDDGETFGKLFNVANSWNFLAYPSRITAEMGLNEMWRIEGALSFSQYKAGKEINDAPATSANSFFAIDFNAKYDLNSLIGETSVFDPYTVSGVGFTMRQGLSTQKGTPTANLGLGFNVWIYKGFGLCLQTTAKFKILPKSSNYLMHSAGIVYQIGFVENGEPKQGSIREAR